MFSFLHVRYYFSGELLDLRDRILIERQEEAGLWLL